MAPHEMPGMKDAVAVLTMLVHGDYLGAIAAVVDAEQPHHLAIALATVGAVVIAREAADPEQLLVDIGRSVAEIEAGI